MPGGSPTGGRRPRAPTDSVDGQLAPGSVASFADGEGSLSDILINGVRWQAKSLRVHGDTHPGMECDLYTTRKRVPYHGDSFQNLIAVHVRGNIAYIWIIPMEKLRKEGKVRVEDEKGNVRSLGVKKLTVHMSAADAAGLPEGPICQPLAGGWNKNKWTEECFAGCVNIGGMVRA